jgi:CheY-like chemotaxis protein/EAL domain-containing protein (putative c-di-GMP-specific phosphodiesterase class I)
VDRIMLVDDEAIITMQLEKRLSAMGYRVVGVASSGEESVQMARRLKPDLVLMDLHMPGADGIELTTLIREHNELYGIPIVFLSSELNTDKQMQALRVGGDDFIAKPISPERLIESVRRCIRSSRSMKGRYAAEKAFSRARKADGSGGDVYPSQMLDRPDSQPDAKLIATIEKALGSEGFLLMYQPIMALRRLPGERYETSLHLKALNGDYIPELDFLPAAQHGGLMPAIDRWVMERALDELARQRNAHCRLRFFVPQTMETLNSEGWLLWFRDQIVDRDLIMQRPVLQFRIEDLSDNRDSAIVRFRDLHRLSIKTCLNLSEKGCEELDLVEELGIALIRLPLSDGASIEPKHVTGFVERVHALGSKVIVSHIEQPQTIARAWRCGVDFIQGNFLQRSSEELSFDFGESALV